MAVAIPPYNTREYIQQVPAHQTRFNLRSTDSSSSHQTCRIFYQQTKSHKMSAFDCKSEIHVGENAGTWEINIGFFYAKDLQYSISPSLCCHLGLADSRSSVMRSSTQWRILGRTMGSGYLLPAFRFYHLPYDKREKFVGEFQYQTNLQNLSCLSSHSCIISAI